MPTYEYECSKCKKTFEKFQSIKEEPIEKCIFCSGSVRRLIGTGGGFLFKGNGFYTTDYRSDSYKKSAQSETASSAASSCAECPQGGTCPSKK
jgi:putative FmdB family regulatory protein